MSEATKLNLHQRLVEVMRTMGAVGKGGKTNYGEKFEYHRIDDIDEALRGALVQHGVVVMIRAIKDRKLEHYSEPDKYGNPRTTWYAECMVVIELVNADDPKDTSSIVGWGQGLDYGDKATGKAISYAAKAAYLSAFHLRGQPDNEEDDIKAPPPANAPTEAPAANQPRITDAASVPKATKPATSKVSKASVPKEAPKVELKKLPDIESLPAEVKKWIEGCQKCDDIDSLVVWMEGFGHESDELKVAVDPYLTEKKKVCWAKKISQCKTVEELADVGNLIASDKNKEMHSALHALYSYVKLELIKEKGK